MTVKEFCSKLNGDDLITINKPDGGFASGYVNEMNDYYNEIIKHISASVHCRALKKNNNILYELDVN